MLLRGFELPGSASQNPKHVVGLRQRPSVGRGLRCRERTLSQFVREPHVRLPVSREAEVGKDARLKRRILRRSEAIQCSLEVTLRDLPLTQAMINGAQLVLEPG